MKRSLTLFILLVALLAGAAAAQPAPLPDDARFDEVVEFKTGPDGESLRAMISALARAVGLTPVVDDVPARDITYDIGDPKPFRQVWDLVLTLNDLNYALLDNDVVVVGTPGSLARLDRPGEPAGDEDVAAEQRFYRVHGDAEQLAEALRRAIDGLSVETLPGVGRLSVEAAPDTHERVERLLADFDPAPEPEPVRERRLYAVERDAAELAEIVRGAVDDVELTPLPDFGRLSVRATEAGHAEVQEVLAEFDVVTEPQPERRGYDVQREPAEVIGMLRDELPELEASPVEGAPRIVVSATPEQHQRVASLLEQVDVAPEPQREPRIYRVQREPDQMADLLRRAVDGLDVESLPGAGRIVVVASEETHERIAAMIDELDAAAREPEPVVTRRLYRVESDPERLVEILQRAVDGLQARTLPGVNQIVVDAPLPGHGRVRELLAEFDVAPQAPAEADPEAERVQRFYRVHNDPEQVVTILRRTMGDLEVEALPGVSSIVVVATADRHDRVQGVLDEFDTVAERAPLVQRVYSLSNAQADELAAVLRDTDVVVGGEAVSEGEEAEGGEGAGERQRGFSVVSDTRTNSLIITATRDVQERLAELIPDLDAPQQQVNVQVRIQEINRRTAHNLGINLAAGFGNLAANVLEGGLNLVFDPQSVITSLNLGATLDALEAQGLSRRVDDSNLTVLNNQTGRMQSGGRIELTFPGNDGELATRTIEFGVIVEVTPRVASDGRVIMDVTAEVSDVLVPLNEGGIPQRIDFSEREVNSTVTLQQGQTVLLGGLLQNSFSQTERRVPILGDLPLIGALFGSTEVENENSELLLVVNAQLVN